MISASTTFIVGAGASKPYGLPTGAELHAKAVHISRESQPYLRLQAALETDSQSLDACFADLVTHPGHSIDEYLEHRRGNPLAQRFGRHLIATLMGQELFDKHASLVANPPHRRDWLELVTREMRAGAREWTDLRSGNNCRFVTFNFDSMIEDALTGHVMSVWPDTAYEEVPTLLEAVKVHHVHGRLPFPKELSPEWVREAAKSIRVVHDDTSQDPTLDAAVKAVEEAEVMCFLGFSFHPSNLEKIGVRQFLLAKGQTVEVFGSVFGMRPYQVAQARERLGPHPNHYQLSDTGRDCLGLLEQEFVIKGR